MLVLLAILGGVLGFWLALRNLENENKKIIKTKEANILKFLDIQKQSGVAENSIKINFKDYNFIFDYDNKTFWFYNASNEYLINKKFDLLLDCKTLVNGTVVQGDFSNVLLGGLVAGGAGAIVGAMAGEKNTKNSIMQLLIYFKSKDVPILSLEFKGDEGINICGNIYARLNGIIHNLF
ncbi:MAG: hypothetical protein IJW82_06265 [Clostridia bacterium]|nr:hypothetical protein [Clostridia bacterium]